VIEARLVLRGRRAQSNGLDDALPLQCWSAVGTGLSRLALAVLFGK